WSLYEGPRESWYRAGDIENSLHQFLAQDRDGYLKQFLVDLVQDPGQHPRAHCLITHINKNSHGCKNKSVFRHRLTSLSIREALTPLSYSDRQVNHADFTSSIILSEQQPRRVERE